MENKNKQYKLLYWLAVGFFALFWLVSPPYGGAKDAFGQLLFATLFIGGIVALITKDKKKVEQRSQEADKITGAIAQLQNSGIAEPVPSPKPRQIAPALPISNPTKTAPPEDELPPIADFSGFNPVSDPPTDTRSRVVIQEQTTTSQTPKTDPPKVDKERPSFIDSLLAKGEVDPNKKPKPEDELPPMGDFSGFTAVVNTPSNYATVTPQRPPATVYEITVPKDSKWTPERATELVEHLLSITTGTAMLQIVATHNEVKWQVVDYLVESDNTAMLIRGIRAVYPEAEVTAEPYTPPMFIRPFYRCAIPYVLTAETKDGVPPWVFPMRYVETCKTNDPLMSIVQALSGDLKEGSTATLTICAVGFTDESTRRRGQGSLKKSNINWFTVGANVLLGGGRGIAQTAVDLGSAAASGTLQTDRYNKEGQKIVEEKPYAKALWDTFVVLQVDATDYTDFTNYDNTATRILHGIKSEYNSLASHSEWKIEAERVDSQAKADTSSTFGLITQIRNQNLAWKFQSVLCAHEIATIFHLPHEGFKSSTIKWIAPGRPNDVVLNNKEGVVIGKSGDNEIRISNEGQPKHTNIVGKSGTGKSTIMHATLHQNIQRGLGMCVVDPHGQFIRDILERSIPDERIDDVVLLDLANVDYPPPLNPFNLTDENGEAGIGQIMAVLDKVYDLSSTTRAVDYIQLALNTIRFRDKPTVRDAVQVLRNPIERQKFLAKYGSKLDRASKEAWRELLARETGHDSILDPVVRRLRRFYQTDYVYAMLCHPDSLNWDRLMKENKIILVSLGVDGQKVPALEQQLLGALVVSQIELTARRAGRDKPLNFRLYIDEAQKFVTTSLPMMFEEIRKYGVWITIANQFLGQLNGRTLDATMGNVTNTFSFEVGKDDARELASYMQPTFTADDLTALGIRRAAVKTVIDGKSQPPFLVDTLPPPPPHPDGISRVERIKKRSIELWTPKTQAEVLAWLDKRYPEEGFGIPKGDEPNKPDPDNEDFEVAG